MKRLLLIIAVLLVLSSPALAQDFNSIVTLNSAIQRQPVTGGFDVRTLGLIDFATSWSTNGTVSAGACSLLGSADNVTFGTTIITGTVTSNGSTALTAANTNFVAINCGTAIVGTGNVSMRIMGWRPTNASITTGAISGNAAAGTTGAGVPSSADYTGVNVGGVLTGVTGTGTSMNVNVTGGVATGVAQGSTTSGQNGGLSQAATTTGAPTYTTGTTNPLSLDTAGNLRVNVVTGAASGNVAQGSTTSGQSGPLGQAAVTTSPPSYTTAQTSPLSLDTAGNLRVTVLNSPTVAVSGITNVTATVGAAPASAAAQVAFQNSGGTASQVVKLDASGNVPVSGSLSVSPNATFGSAAPSTGFMEGFRNGSNADYGSTNGSHQQQIEVAAITAAATGPATNANSDSIVISPYQLSWTDASLALTTGGTSQTLMATNSSRHGFLIQNPCTAAEQGLGTAENININFTSAANDTGGHSITIAPCGSYGENTGFITTEAITVNAPTTAHIIIAKYR